MAPEPSARPASGGVIPHELKAGPRLAAWLIFGGLRLCEATLRLRFHDESGILRERERPPIIFCLWHNRLALSMAIYHRYVKRSRSSPGLVALISASRDGALLAGVLDYFGVRAVRGSTSRRGPQAFLELTSWAEAGYDIAITPDGPRGPRYHLQEGIIALAQLTGHPIVPVSTYVGFKSCLRSWDRFQIPWPLARADIYFGPALNVPGKGSAAERESCRQELRRRMEAMTRD